MVGWLYIALCPQSYNMDRAAPQLGQIFMYKVALENLNIFWEGCKNLKQSSSFLTLLRSVKRKLENYFKLVWPSLFRMSKLYRRPGFHELFISNLVFIVVSFRFLSVLATKLRNTKILRNLCLHFARQDGQDGNLKNKQTEHIVKKISQLKWPKYKKQKTKIWDERNININYFEELPTYLLR